MKSRNFRRLFVMLMALVMTISPLCPLIATAQVPALNKRVVNVFNSAARGTTTSTVSSIGDADGFVGFLDVTANSGTNPTLDVVIYDSADGSAPWFTLVTFTQVTGSTNSQVVAASRAPLPYTRAIATVGGSSTPTFTFSLRQMAYRGPAVAITTNLGAALSGTSLAVNGANGESAAIKSISESITLSTGGATTDSSANLLPANSLILAVVARVTTTITTATDWKLGDANVAGRFTAANSTLTAGTTDISSVQWKADTTAANAGPIQVAAAKLRITTTGTPGAGAIRVTVFYVPFTAPTS